MLGRLPESDEAINAKKHYAISDLRKTFVESYEFKILHRPTMTPPMSPLENLSHVHAFQVFQRTVSQWNKLGEVDPYWSVLSSDEHHGQLNAWELEKFYDSGEREVRNLLRILEESGIKTRLANYKILELGCGVGRLTKSLAALGADVIAVDISKANISIAAKALKEFSNVSFITIESLDDLDRLEIEFDMFFSVITLQHNHAAVQLVLLDKILKQMIKSGSIAYFQTVIASPKMEFIDDTFDTFALPTRFILDVIHQNNFRLVNVFRDDYQLDPDFHSYTFIAQKR
jgi:2-polyprenyl-3-methyl-5-hydroxy-6-metoxy-1,4-benzoquinol methylase